MRRLLLLIALSLIAFIVLSSMLTTTTHQSGSRVYKPRIEHVYDAKAEFDQVLVEEYYSENDGVIKYLADEQSPQVDLDSSGTMNTGSRVDVESESEEAGSSAVVGDAEDQASSEQVDVTDQFEDQLQDLPQDQLEDQPSQQKYQEVVKQPEQFLAYLPHSGFNNQLGELENALILAKLVNRTLILPPVYLGVPEVSWNVYNSLTNMIIEAERLLMGGSPTSPFGGRITRARMNRRALLPMPLFFNLTGFKTISTTNYVQSHTAGSLLRIKENIRLQFRYVDQMPRVQVEGLSVNGTSTNFENEPVNPQNAKLSVGRYLRTFDNGTQTITEQPAEGDLPLKMFKYLVNWQKSSHDLIILGSAFSYARLLLTLPENQEYQQQVKRQLMLSNPILESITDKIVKFIESKFSTNGGTQWIGVHLRSGDGSFKDDVSQTVNRMVDRLKSLECGGQSKAKRCLQRPINLYIATDLPKQDTETLKPIIEYADTIVTGQDINWRQFDLELDSLTQKRLKSQQGSMTELLNYVNGVKQEQYDQKLIQVSNTIWIPFLDQMVAARGLAFIGTRGSTFSGYVARLHQAYSKEPWIIGKV